MVNSKSRATLNQRAIGLPKAAECEPEIGFTIGERPGMEWPALITFPKHWQCPPWNLKFSELRKTLPLVAN